jgi:very-short-patch-repair endonuclease
MKGLKTNQYVRLPSDYQKQATKPKKSNPVDLAVTFEALWLRFGSAPELVREFTFHPARKWRFDVAFPWHRLAVELEGGIWTKGAHTRGKHYQSDCEKYNAAALAGWRVLRYTTDDLTKRPLQVVEEVAMALKGS